MKRDRTQPPARLYLAAAVRDAAGVDARPGAVAVRDGRVLAAGTEAEARAATRGGAVEVVERWAGCLLLPSLVNAHAHLDLTGLGPRPYGGDFAGWLRAVAIDRPTTLEAIDAAVRRGAELSRAAAVEWVGDLAYAPHAIAARRATGLPGVSYLEAFGLGERQAQRIAELRARLDALPFETPAPGHARGVVVGISPHAPYSAGRDLYEAATQLSENRAYRVCTHAAETREELALLRDGSGPFADLLAAFGYAAEDLAAAASGLHPLDHLEPYLRRARWLLAHCNDATDDHIRLLERTGTSVAYCPAAAEYFGHRGHRYRDMLAAGVNVCLGTDSILCQDPAAAQPLSILDQMRLLWRRDRTDPATLLAMATTHGMIGLEFRPQEATLGEGAPAIFGAVPIDPADAADALVQALENGRAIEPVRDPGGGTDKEATDGG